jgi:hypothetical protein
MNADLMRPTRLQPAFHQGEMAQFLHHLDMSDRPLSPRAFWSAAAPAVSPITNQKRFDPPGLRSSLDNGQITALHGMSPELFAEMAFCLDCAREDNETAGFLVQPMDRPNALPLAGVTGCEEVGQQVGQGRRQIALGPATEFCGLVRVPHGRDPCRFVHHHDLRIDMADYHPGWHFHFRARLFPLVVAYFQALACLGAKRRVSAWLAGDLDLVLANQTADRGPG